MKTKRNFYNIPAHTFALFILLMFLGCQKEKDIIKHINIKYSTKAINSDNMIKNVRVVKLETLNQSIIDEIFNIKIYKNKIYVLEQTGSINRILVFDINGKFVSELGSYGRGPNEIGNPYSFCFKDSNVFVWDKFVHKLTIENKYLEKMFETQLQVSSFDIKGENFIFFHGPSNEAFVTVMDQKGNTIEQFKAQNINYDLGCSSTDAIMNFGSETSFFSIMLDVIYKLKEGKLVPGYKMIYNGMHSIADILPNQSLTPPELMQIMRKKEHCSNYKYFENDSIIFLTNHFQKKQFKTILFKDKWKSHSFGAIRNVNLNVDLSPDFIVDSKTFCKVLYLYDLLGNDNVNIKSDKKISDLVEKSKIDDNPILYLYNFKNLSE
jgi:hypothetical protein